jgi:hypothetical protein
MFIGALVMIGVFLVIALLLRGIAPSGATDEIEKAEVRRANLADLTKKNEAEMTTYGWVDREKGIVRMPIEEAMLKEAAILNQQEPRPAYAIATPAPAPPAEAPAVEAPATQAEQSATPGTPGTAPAESAAPAPTTTQP